VQRHLDGALLRQHEGGGHGGAAGRRCCQARRGHPGRQRSTQEGRRRTQHCHPSGGAPSAPGTPATDDPPCRRRCGQTRTGHAPHRPGTCPRRVYSTLHCTVGVRVLYCTRRIRRTPILYSTRTPILYRALYCTRRIRRACTILYTHAHCAPRRACTLNMHAHALHTRRQHRPARASWEQRRCARPHGETRTGTVRRGAIDTVTCWPCTRRLVTLHQAHALAVHQAPTPRVPGHAPGTYAQPHTPRRVHSARHAPARPAPRRHGAGDRERG
jgi:hypothetical protein